MSMQEALSASGLSSEKLSLPTLQSKMKCDPEGYESELVLLYSQFKSSVELCQQQAAQNFTSFGGVSSDPTVAKSLGEKAMFLAHVTPFYPHQLSEFPKQLADLLRSSARSLPSALRCHLAQSLILLINRQMVDIGENLALFMELQTLGDRELRKLAFSHIIHSIKRMNQKHKNEVKNRMLQNTLFAMLQKEDEALAKRSLVALCELHRRKLWFDDRTANAICTSCFHPSTRIMVATLSFLLDYEKIIDADDDDSDGLSSEDDSTPVVPHAVLSREAVYKAHHQGTISSKKKKKAKLQRVIRSMKKKQRLSSERNTSDHYSPLNHLKDAQGFAEKLFSRLQTCNERFEVKMMMLKVISRTVGLHHLILLNFYPFLLKYCQPHQRDVTSLLAAAVQTCHDMVPPDAVEPLFKQIVNQFVHDHSRPEAIAVGINVIREICLRMPLLMTEDLLQDLALYKKSHEKAVSVAARSLIGLFREVCPSLLVKKDRGRPTNPTARPKAYGEVSVVSDVPGVELLQDDSDKTDEDGSGSDNEENASGDECTLDDNYGSEDDKSEEYNANAEDRDVNYSTDGTNDNEYDSEFDDDNDEEEDDSDVSEDEAEEVENNESNDDGAEDSETEDPEMENKNGYKESLTKMKDSKVRKRKFPDFKKQIIAADSSLQALKGLARTMFKRPSSDEGDGILSNEDFQKIKKRKAKEEAKLAMTQHGLLRKGSDAKATAFKIPSSDQLSAKRVDPAQLEVHVRKKLTKEERLAIVRAGREDRGKYQARAAVKQKKTGGMSNRQKEHKKAMPLAAKRSKITKSRVQKKKQEQRSGKHFRGKKAWK